MTLKGINFRSVLIAGLIGGYVMMQVDRFFAGSFGLFGIFPNTGQFYIEHHIDAVLFAILFAWPAVYLRLPGKGWMKGTLYGLLLWVAVSVVSAIAAATGSFAASQAPMSISAMVSAVIVHLVYGFFVGAVYVTPPESNQPAEETYYMFRPRKHNDFVHHNR